MKIDMHLHTFYSDDSIITPTELIQMARQRGLDAVCVTEHDSYESSEPVKEAARKEGFLLFRGAELRTEQGHLLVYGIQNDNFLTAFRELYGKNKLPNMQDMIDYVASVGGTAVPSHPYRTGYTKYLGDFSLSLRNIPALETENGISTDRENAAAHAAAMQMGLKETGGSDAHTPEQIGMAYTVFEREIKTMKELVRELRTGSYTTGRLPGNALLTPRRKLHAE